MILYFSGTGNSRYVAQALADRLGDSLVCANPDIKAGKKGSYTSDRPFVFVFPVYLSTIPAIFREYLCGCTFDGGTDAYFVPTCASASGSVPNAAGELCKALGLTFRGSKKVKMPQNYIALFPMFDEEKRRRCFAEAEHVISGIAESIARGADLDDKPASAFENRTTAWVEGWYNHDFAKTAKFFATNACVGCGLCEKQCPTNAIVLKDGKPVWVKKTCIHCMACINRCPEKAIEYGKKTIGKQRYVCPMYQRKQTEL